MMYKPDSWWKQLAPKRRRRFPFHTLLLAVCMLAAAAAGANVGVVDAGESPHDLDILVEMLKTLGHQAEKLPAGALYHPAALRHFDCIILAHRSGPLTEAGYLALDEYVRRGGTLLLTGLAAYWMKMPGAMPARQPMAVGGPLRETAGVKILGSREMPIKNLKVVAKAPAVMGLPEAFTIQTVPAYDADNPASWRHAGVFGIQAVSATVLIKVESVDAAGAVVEGDFLTVKQSGRGRCYRWALCRMVPMLFEKKEKNMTLILQNILRHPPSSQSLKSRI